MLEQLSSNAVLGIGLFIGTLLGALITTITMTLRDMHYQRQVDRHIAEWARLNDVQIERLNQITESLNE